MGDLRALRFIISLASIALLMACSSASHKVDSDMPRHHAQLQTAPWMCTFDFHFGPGNDKAYTGTGPTQQIASNAAIAACINENALSSYKAICQASPIRNRCFPPSQCRVLAQDSPRSHHNNWCLQHGFAGYDPAPERTYGVGACFRTDECAQKGPGDRY